MTSEEIQAAREWSARLMEWRIMTYKSFCLLHNREPIDYRYDSMMVWVDKNNQLALTGYMSWTPDEDSNQTFMVVGQMAKLGWYLSLDQSMTEPHEWTALFYKAGHPVRLGTVALEPAQAILLDAMVAVPEIKE